jgi:L-amino acid N-acyltransferase YncA
VTDTPRIRSATAADADAITAIYRHYVLTHTSTFEIDPPDATEMTARMQRILQTGLPYLVAELAGRVVGYCYVTPYRPRAAYRFTIENSVYVAPGLTARGIGRLLLQELLQQVKNLGYREVIAVIGDSANIPSITLHRKAGFVEVGTLRNVGFKFDRWLDTVLMQLTVDS